MNLPWLPFYVDGLKMLVIFGVLFVLFACGFVYAIRVSRGFRLFWRRNRLTLFVWGCLVLLLLAIVTSLGRKGEGDGREGGANGGRAAAAAVGRESGGVSAGAYRLHGRVDGDGRVILQLDGEGVHEVFVLEGEDAMGGLRTSFVDALGDAEPGTRLELHLAEAFPRGVRRMLWEWLLQFNLMVREI